MVSPHPKTHLFNTDSYICTLKSNICIQNALHSCRHDTQRNDENTENTKKNDNTENNENTENTENTENNENNEKHVFRGFRCF